MDRWVCGWVVDRWMGEWVGGTILLFQGPERTTIEKAPRLLVNGSVRPSPNYMNSELSLKTFRNLLKSLNLGIDI